MAGITTVLLLFASVCGAISQPTAMQVDCLHGLDSNDGSFASPFKSVRRALQAIQEQRQLPHEQDQYLREGSFAPMDVHISGLCELNDTLKLTSPLDSNVAWIGDGNFTILSGGTQIFPK